MKALFSHGGGKLFDYCLANSTPFPEEVLARHRKLGGNQTVVDEGALEELGVSTILRPMLRCDDGYAHHDPRQLARAIMELYRDKSPTKIYG